jgi:ABC-type branched-subunit amino acid transport system permease subunit
MNNMSPNKTRRLAFIISGATDALIGAILLLMGFGLLPLEVTDYGFENWHALLLGGALFIIGIWVVAYNLSRLEE